jgi:hypothetical protein
MLRPSFLLREFGMKKNIFVMMFVFCFPLLQAGWYERTDDPKQEVQGAFVEIAQTSARAWQAPDMTKYAHEHREFYVHMASSGFHSANKWYLFDGSQEAAQAIQQSATGWMTWYYHNPAKDPEK